MIINMYQKYNNKMNNNWRLVNQYIISWLWCKGKARPIASIRVTALHIATLHILVLKLHKKCPMFYVECLFFFTKIQCVGPTIYLVFFVRAMFYVECLSLYQNSVCRFHDLLFFNRNFVYALKMRGSLSKRQLYFCFLFLLQRPVLLRNYMFISRWVFIWHLNLRRIYIQLLLLSITNAL